jgi:hypothetical protein
MVPLTDQQRNQIESAIFAGRKIEAIKLYREAAGGELADAKRAVEDLEVDLRRSQPDRFVKSSRSCVVVLACYALLFGIFAFLIIHFVRS